jgi:hypothetical protein
LQRRKSGRLEQRQIPEALEQRPACSLELFTFLVGGSVADLVAADFIDGILYEPLHVESIEDELGFRGAVTLHAPWQ